MKIGLLLPAFTLMSAAAVGQDWRPLFDGRTLDGWEGDAALFRVHDGAIVGGSLVRSLEHNAFLCSAESFGDFVLRLQIRLAGEDPNAGIQFRSERLPGSTEVVGYQADAGQTYWGALYDESRRRRILAAPDSARLAGLLHPNGWNDYALYASGRRIRLFLNGSLTADYTEPDTTLPQHGRICLQIHSGPAAEAHYRNIQIKPVPRRPEAPVPPGPVRFRKRVLSERFVSEGVAAGDLDRDGDLDIVAGAYWFEAPDWRAHEITPPDTFSVHTGYSDTFLNYTLDVNGDDWLDVVAFGPPGRAAYWFENPRGGSGHWTRRLVFPTVASENPILADLTGDGLDEAAFLDRQSRRIVILQPSRSADTTWALVPVSEPLEAARARSLAHGLGAGDVNGDGRADLVAVDAWWEAPAVPGAAWKEHPADLGERAAEMLILDLDGDGDADVLSSSAHDYGIWWAERRPAETPAWSRRLIDNRVSQTHALAAADLDGDGRTDFVTGKRFFAHNGNDPGGYEPSELLWYAASDGRPAWTPYLIDPDAGVGLQVVARDITGDGRPDVLLSNKKGVFLFENVGN